MKDNQHRPFPILAWTVTRGDIGCAFMDEDDQEPDWPFELTDAQMDAIANRISRYLEYSMDIYWSAVREATDDIVNRTFIHFEDAA